MRMDASLVYKKTFTDFFTQIEFYVQWLFMMSDKNKRAMVI